MPMLQVMKVMAMLLMTLESWSEPKPLWQA